MNVTWRWSLLVIIPIVLVVDSGLFRLSTAPGDSAIVASIGQSATISASPGRADAENTFIIGGVSATALRLISRSLDMDMGVTPYLASPLGNGRWRVINVEVPMVGHWGIEVQARHNRSWTVVGKIVYDVPFTGTMRLVTTNLRQSL